MATLTLPLAGLRRDGAEDDDAVVVMLLPDIVASTAAREAVLQSVKDAGFDVEQQQRLQMSEEQARAWCELSGCMEDMKEEVKEAVESPKRRSGKSGGKKRPSSKKKARAPLPAPDDADEGAKSPEEAKVIDFLTSGPVHVLRLQRELAVESWAALLGPMEDVSRDGGHSLRARFGSSRLHSVAYGSSSPAVVERDDDFFFDQEFLIPADSLSPRAERAERSATVYLHTLFAFLFPDGVLHPRSTGRLVVFGLYGPLDEAGELRSGYRGSHVVTGRELKAMMDEIDREDIVSVFVKEKGLTITQKEEIVSQASKLMKERNNLSRKQVTAMFAHLPRTDDGGYSFHDLQRVILEARRQRVQALKEMYPALVKKSKGSAAEEEDTALPKRRRMASAKIVSDSKVADEEAFLVVSAKLSRHAYAIADIDGQNNPELTQNVFLLRDDTVPEGKEEWDSTSCLKGSHKGSYVRAHRK